MNKRDEYLLRQGYEAGYRNATYDCEDNARLIGAIKEESERWVNEVIADNGGTVGEYITHNAPENKE